MAEKWRSTQKRNAQVQELNQMVARGIKGQRMTNPSNDTEGGERSTRPAPGALPTLLHSATALDKYMSQNVIFRGEASTTFVHVGVFLV